MKKKTIERIAVLSFAAIIMLSMGGVVLSSYTNYRSTYDQIMSKNISEDNLNLRSIEVSLKEGVTYFNNGLASPTKNDLIVKAFFGGTYAKPLTIILEAEEYDLIVDKQFALKGGKISVKYNGKESAPLNVTLTKVIPTSLIVKENPYIVTYAVNDIFSSEGMVVEAIYNDGSSRRVSNFKVSNTNPLAKKDKEVTISYQEEDVTVETKLPITVLDSVDNGKFVTLDVGDNYVVHGQKLTKLDRVLGTYKNGNKKLIPATDYTIESENVAKLGLEYKANVSLISDPTNKIEVKAHVLSQVNAKNFVCENITQKTKDVESYVIEDGKFVSTGLITVNNGGFKTKYAEYKPSTRKSLKTTYVANAHTDGDLWIRCGNYNWDGTAMLPSHFEYMFDLYVNGRQVDFGKDAIIPGFEVDTNSVTSLGFEKAQDLAFQTFFDVNLGNVNLLNGNNEIELVLNLDEEVELNTWSETADIKMESFKVVVNKDVPIHNLKHVDEKDFGCEAEGVAEHYACSTCGETFKDEKASEIMLDTTIPSGNHKFDKFTTTETHHITSCSVCGESIEEEHSFDIKKHDDATHWNECECGRKTTALPHDNNKLQAYSTKSYDVGEVIDQSAINVSFGCDCGYAKDVKSSCQITFNETTASINSKATCVYNNETYIIPIPLNSVKIEAENCNIENDASNYQLIFAEYEVETGVAENGGDIVGTKSLKGDVKKDDSGNILFGNTSLTMKIYSDADRTLSLSMLGASTFNGNGAITMEEVCDLTVNDVATSFAEDAKFVGGGTKWFGWEDVHLANISLVPGENVINILVNYTTSKTQKSGQGPFNVDYFYFDLI